MLSSMTGYGRHSQQFEQTEMKVEMKSVNSRFLELNLRLPRRFFYLEMELKKRLQEKLHRGKVDIFIELRSPASSFKELQVDDALIRHLKNIEGEHGLAPLGIGDLLAMDGALEWTEKEADEGIEEALLQCFMKALDELLASRQREGQALETHLEQLTKDLQGHLEEIQANAQQWKLDYHESFKERMETLLEDKSLISEDRLEFELALFAEKKDIEEELQRAATHVKALDQDIHGEAPHGRKLDFLLQELLREVNTMGSKSASAALTKEVIGAKSVLDKLREQIQNVE